MVCSPACILTSSTSTSMSSGLARASWTSMELFEMDMHQLQQAAAMVILSDMTIILARQCGTKQTASKLATSGSSSAAVGEMVASTTVEPTSPHGPHERRERREQTAFAVARNFYLILSYVLISRIVS